MGGRTRRSVSSHAELTEAEAVGPTRDGNYMKGAVQIVRADARKLSAVDFSYVVDAQWEQPPAGTGHKDVAAVDTDSHDRVYLLTRFESNLLIYERDGTFITAWGGEYFTRPHGLTVGPDDCVYTVDDGDHSVRKFSADGELLMTLGRPGEPSATGHRRDGQFVVHNVETVERPGPPFNGCTNLAINSAGRIYVADGYGNCRVHVFSPDGDLISSWGEVGIRAGQFHLPHGIAIGPDDRVYVCDRENDRIQVFDPDGRFLAQWTDVQWRPLGTGSFTHGFLPDDRPGRVTIFDPRGDIVARWGASTVSRAAPGNFIAPHGITVDSHGDLYVCEVSYTFGVMANGIDPDLASAHQIQKFTRS
jgi:DNA-binding beta-propeller fold protein YncE